VTDPYIPRLAQFYVHIVTMMTMSGSAAAVARHFAGPKQTVSSTQYDGIAYLLLSTCTDIGLILLLIASVPEPGADLISFVAIR
jgi:hypothetical protein